MSRPSARNSSKSCLRFVRLSGLVVCGWEVSATSRIRGVAISVSEFDVYFKWLGIPPADQPPDHYRLLGIPAFTSDADVIANAIDRQVAYVRTFALGPHSLESQRLLNELATARLCLESPQEKSAYDQDLRDRHAGTQSVNGTVRESGRVVVSVARTTRNRFLGLVSVFCAVGICVLVMLGVFWNWSEPTTRKEQAQEQAASPRTGGSSSDEVQADRTGTPSEESDRQGEKRQCFGVLTATLRVADSSPFFNAFSFSPDGKRIVSGSDDDTAKVWDVQTGQETFTLKGHSDSVTSVSFSPDAKRIVSGSGDKTVKVWDANTGQETRTIKTEHTDGVTSVGFSPDGKRIVSGSDDKTLKIWNVQTGQEIHTLKGHSGSVTSVSFSPDGKWIVSGSDDQTLKIWNAQTGQEIHTLKGHSASVTSVSFSPDAKRIVSGSGDKTVKVWDANTGQETRTIKTEHTDGVTSVGFSPDGNRIVSGGVGKTLKVWDVQTGQKTVTLYGHSETVTSVSFSPDGKEIFSRSSDCMVKVWILVLDSNRNEKLDAGDFANHFGVKKPDQVYLDDFPELDFRVRASFTLGKHGDTGYEGQPQSVVFGDGGKPEHCLSMHACTPKQGGAAFAKYELNKKYQWFTSRCAFSITGELKSDVTFRVLGDEKELWSSPPTGAQSKSYDVAVDVSSVDILTLQIKPVDDETNATTIWLNPLLLSKQSSSPVPASSSSGPVQPMEPIETTNSIGMKLRLIPTGQFMMGSPDSDTNAERREKPQHLVKVTKPFYLGVFEVTQQQYEKVMDRNPSRFKGPRNPVNQVNWHDAVEFCQKLSALSAEKSSGRHYRLPTEAEWEFACRAGSTTVYGFGDEASRLGDYAWFSGNSRDTVHPVGRKKPNAWGLYDMHGNVWEWCQDWFGNYPASRLGRLSFLIPPRRIDPTGPKSGSYRVYRGGGIEKHALKRLRSASRGAGVTLAHFTLGFRVVCETTSERSGK